MSSLLPLLLLAASGVEPALPSYPYSLTVDLVKYQNGQSFSTFDHHVLAIRGASTKRVPGSSPYYFSVLTVEPIANGIDAIATEESHITAMPIYPKDRSERGFRFVLNSLRLPASGEQMLRVRFSDSTDIYRIRYENGLHVEPVDLEGGSIEPTSFPRFRNINVIDGQDTYQCNPITTSATRKGALLWTNDIGMDGQPETLEVLEKVLLVRTTVGHTLYVLKETGEVVFYARAVLGGKDPWAEVMPYWLEDVANADSVVQRHRNAVEARERGESIERPKSPARFKHPNRYPYIRAAALLEDQRAIPLLIECVGDGFGLQEKAAAVAALEKINGNATPWKEARHPGLFLGAIAMDRVYPKENALAEQAKWRETFGIRESIRDE